MTLVERYLNAVRFFLPHRDQDDIVRELSENLSSEMEDRSQALGRDLSEPEVADILRRHGHPALVASRFAPRQHLIGPVVFPIYLFALKLGLGAALVVTVVLAVITSALQGVSVPVLFDGLKAYPTRALLVFAWTTLGFAAVDALGARAGFAPDWDPRRIPDWMGGRRQASRLHDRLQAGTEVVFGGIALVWLLLVPTSPWLAMGPLAAVLAFAPIWSVWYAPMVAVAAGNFLVDAYGLVRPTRTPRRLVLKLLLLGAQLGIALMILSARVWVVVAPHPQPGVVPAETLPALLTWVNTGVAIGFGVMVVATLVEMGKQYYRLRTLGRTPDR
ncbi:hypothetical protein TBR22_A33330 [Luteitalea sp. TBR-22]|uniref:hypothetical protein n=1 Tax=Luteitalea sp. TBR-22 TaxID=2802971 RepID=UPI001AF9C51B|nr:hypothetical protein [Luteitalea sp. TBR-22]BCS34104.1 hypothetical protein TBR22_A33330 [Luteitalea sp. TBR-22]